MDLYIIDTVAAEPFRMDVEHLSHVLLFDPVLESLVLPAVRAVLFARPQRYPVKEEHSGIHSLHVRNRPGSAGTL